MSVHTGYEPARSCTGAATDGARALMAWFLGAYGSRGGRNLGIYNCRSIAGSSTTSLHGEGRATDLGVPVGAPWAQALADRLVAMSAELGIQCVIYARRIWSGSYPNAGWRPYNGLNAHVDHLHVELSWSGARTLTAATVQRVLGGTPAPVPGARPTIRAGSRGDAVREAQNRLAAHGFGPGAADGVFGPKTTDAAKRFQGARGLAADGIVGPRTWAALLAAPPAPPTPAPTSARPVIRRGAKGDAVREVQRILNAWYPALPRLVVDGDFGAATDARVRHMQRAAGLAVDGVVGPATWRRLLGG
ncbi:peptidoglycan-binding domain-containing protein [Actinokineospora sp.]|uniref:peptidoglycan-binding domain-containing protein n=1 Tax=Actinokineospora sp. TaxID=1872133 RepID=UPI003D6BC58A